MSELALKDMEKAQAKSAQTGPVAVKKKEVHARPTHTAPVTTWLLSLRSCAHRRHRARAQVPKKKAPPPSIDGKVAKKEAPPKPAERKVVQMGDGDAEDELERKKRERLSLTSTAQDGSSLVDSAAVELMRGKQDEGEMQARLARGSPLLLLSSRRHFRSNPLQALQSMG